MKGNQNAEGLSTDVPDFKEMSHGVNDSLVLEVHGKKPMGRAQEILTKREQAHVPQRGRGITARNFRRTCKRTGRPNGTGSGN